VLFLCAAVMPGTYHQGEPMEKAEGPEPTAQRSPKGAAAAALRSEAVDRETASPKRARTADGSPALQQQQQPQQQHSNPASQLLEQVRCLLQAAVQELQQSTASGCELTSQLLPVVKVLPAPQQQHQHQQQPKHKHSWPPGTICTSPCAHALAAVVRKHTSAPKQQPQQQQQQQPVSSLQTAAPSSSCCLWTQPDQLASNLADRFNSMAAASQPAVALTAVATRGHINFLQQGSTDAQQQGQTHGLQQQSVQQQQRGSQNHGSHGPAAMQQQQQQEEAQTQAHRLEVRMVPNQFIQEEFELWQRYQVGGWLGERERCCRHIARHCSPATCETSTQSTCFCCFRTAV